MPGALYGFAYTERALSFLEGLQQKFRRQIIKKVQELVGNPYSQNSKLVHGKMDGENRVYRIRSGDYRILYSVRESPAQIVILDIGHRKDVYR